MPVPRKCAAGVALITTLLVMVLLASIVASFMWLVLGDQRLSGNTNDRQRAFYAAEAGMEKLTSDLNTLFQTNSTPTGPQILALHGLASEPAIAGIQYIDPSGNPPCGLPPGPGSGYRIDYPTCPGNPNGVNHLILSGPYQGMTGLETKYTLDVIASTTTGSEVKLQRAIQTVAIPVFQFGMFCAGDCSFFAGPDFNFGGRMHTNGNLFLAEGGGTLTLADKVTAYGNVIRTNLSNGFPTSTNYAGTVDLLTAPGSYRAMAMNEGSLTGNLGSPANSNWPNISMSIYNGNIRDGNNGIPVNTGVQKLNLGIATPALGGQPIDLIRRPVQGEDAALPAKLGERYYNQASLKILISDNPADIMLLPCIDATKQPIDLSSLAQLPASPTFPAAVTLAAAASGTTLVPLAASGSVIGGRGGPGPQYNAFPQDGYWLPSGTPTITGFIKIEEQTSQPNGGPCGTWKDVTAEILGLGYAGRDLNPVAGVVPLTNLPPLPAGQIAPSACQDPNPNAIIRLERVRDNPSNQAAAGACGVNGAVVPPLTSDYWPNVLFDPREGNQRDWCPSGGAGGGACNLPANGANASAELQGVMHYVELDAGNLAKWFTGAIGASGPASKDNTTSSHNFAVYFSDRRGNYVAAPVPGGWPPQSPSGNETGEYGFEDFINPGNASACPNGALDPGEDLDLNGNMQTYGAYAAQEKTPPVPGAPLGAYSQLLGQFFPPVVAVGATSAIVPNWNCPTPVYAPALPGGVWPGWYVRNPQEARENPPLFFRRALKIVNGSQLNLGLCPDGVNCGLTIAAENPVYVQGDFNANGSFGTPYVATSIVADSFTFLSNNWNDVNSFTGTYDTALRRSATTWYRVAIAAGKGISFPQPGGFPTGNDFGTDGGVHNFLRYIESWGGQTLNYRGSIVSLFMNRQGVGIFKCCTTVYSPPTRGYNFDTDFLTPTLLPPDTPMFRTVNTIGFTEWVLAN